MDERRKQARMDIALPLRIEGHDPQGTPWQEMTRCADASSGGASFLTSVPVQTGQVLRLSMPLPRRFRTHDPMSPSYHVYAVVQSVESLENGSRVGVSFFGKTPPAGFEQNPGGRFLKDRRRARRTERYLKVLLGPEAEGSARAERTVLENLGDSGARVMTSMPLEVGEVVRLEELDSSSFRTRAEVRHAYVGHDGIRRLNLRFLEPLAP